MEARIEARTEASGQRHKNDTNEAERKAENEKSGVTRGNLTVGGPTETTFSISSAVYKACHIAHGSAARSQRGEPAAQARGGAERRGRGAPKAVGRRARSKRRLSRHFPRKHER